MNAIFSSDISGTEAAHSELLHMLPLQSLHSKTDETSSVLQAHLVRDCPETNQQCYCCSQVYHKTDQGLQEETHVLSMGGGGGGNSTNKTEE